MTNLEYFQKLLAGDALEKRASPTYPPAIAITIGFKLTEIGLGTATVELQTDVKKHANPMGTVHGGVFCDVADSAIGTAHFTTLQDGESFTSVDLQINFFRPVWNEKIIAKARVVHPGKTLSRYVCDVTNEAGKLVAQVTSTVMTLRGEKAQGR